MDFFSIILFLILYHIRPHEWIGAVDTLRPTMIAMLMALYGTFTREKGFSLSLLFKTPHDWLMLGYLIWIVITSPSPLETWKVCYSLFLYYFIIMLALSSIQRVRSFLNWWALLLVVVALLAIASEYGFDPMYSYDKTHGIMKGRLVLNTYIFNNPNALGHSVIPAVAMLYFLFWWKRFVTFKLMFLPMAAVCGYCTFLTQSKGAFVSAFATWLASYLFRRPLIVQVVVLAVALTAGTAALKSLPRMGDLENPTAEGGIQGRIWVFRWGLETLQRTVAGVGWGGFDQGFADAYGFLKSPHSSYVAVGTELGWPGLTLFIAILYAAFKTLFLAKPRNEEEDRVRRVLFALLISYAVSSWMVGWSSRANFFIMIAVTAAFHRHLLGLNDAAAGREDAVVGLDGTLMTDNRSHLIARALDPRKGEKPESDFVSASGAQHQEPVFPGITWNKFGFKDIIFVGAITYIVIRIWSYAVYRL